MQWKKKKKEKKLNIEILLNAYSLNFTPLAEKISRTNSMEIMYTRSYIIKLKLMKK